MKHTILPTIVGSMLAIAPIVDSTFQFNTELTRPSLTEKNSLVVHEWGTFTALQGSNGVPVNGMQHEEEHLPSFVHSRDLMQEPDKTNATPCPGFCKGFEPGTIYHYGVNHLPVTQKMETPVLYFYSKNGVPNVEISIDFPQGIISQYYPNVASFLPEYGKVSQMAGGNVKFKFNILGDPDVIKAPSIPEVELDSVYAPSREVNSNYITTEAGESEKLIFYRGLGDFHTDVKVTSNEKGLTIHNNSKSLHTPMGILYYATANGESSFFVTRALDPSESQFFSNEQIRILKLKAMLKNSTEEASEKLAKLLIENGLYKDEAVAMVNTWKKSYFGKSGLRYLHILDPRATESLLPLKMTPQPTELVRVMVGRIEIFTYEEERELISQLATQGQNFNLNSLGRMAEAKLRRVHELVPPGFQTDINILIDKAVYSE